MTALDDDEMYDNKMDFAAGVWRRTIGLHPNVDFDTFRVHLPRPLVPDCGQFHRALSLNIICPDREEH